MEYNCIIDKNITSLPQLLERINTRNLENSFNIFVQKEAWLDDNSIIFLLNWLNQYAANKLECSIKFEPDSILYPYLREKDFFKLLASNCERNKLHLPKHKAPLIPIKIIQRSADNKLREQLDKLKKQLLDLLNQELHYLHLKALIIMISELGDNIYVHGPENTTGYLVAQIQTNHIDFVLSDDGDGLLQTFMNFKKLSTEPCNSEIKSILGTAFKIGAPSDPESCGNGFPTSALRLAECNGKLSILTQNKYITLTFRRGEYENDAGADIELFDINSIPILFRGTQICASINISHLLEKP